ncbi:hypothetical protein [Pseudoxanthomonas yeongjuensis]|uniref:hypothetical protein n=1 Tax=Pseudoxanthomonas yeongjuensis TaxID=377616 RepID=UPI003CCD6D1E
MNASMSRVASPFLVLLLVSCLTACKPEPPPLEQPPEPKASATELRDAIKRPIDQAKAVEAATQEAAEKQRAEIEAVTN